MAQELFDFDNPWRPVYEGRQAIGWFVAAAGCLASSSFLPLPLSFGALSATSSTATQNKPRRSPSRPDAPSHDDCDG